RRAGAGRAPPRPARPAGGPGGRRWAGAGAGRRVLAGEAPGPPGAAVPHPRDAEGGRGEDPRRGAAGPVVPELPLPAGQARAVVAGREGLSGPTRGRPVAALSGVRPGLLCPRPP